MMLVLLGPVVLWRQSVLTMSAAKTPSIRLATTVAATLYGYLKRRQR
jgi:hypothetical protein